MNQTLTQLLAQQFNENIGNKITVALAHGILLAVDQWQRENEKQTIPTEQVAEKNSDAIQNVG